MRTLFLWAIGFAAVIIGVSEPLFVQSRQAAIKAAQQTWIKQNARWCALAQCIDEDRGNRRKYAS